MQLIPAMEIRHGKCVHTHFDGKAEVIIAEDPVEVAERWLDAGAHRLHLVDVDAIMQKEAVNADAIAAIAERFPELQLQVAAGIQNEENILVWLDSGVQQVIVGCKAVRSRSFVTSVCLEFPNRIIVALDGRAGEASFTTRQCGNELIALAKRFEDDGVSALIYTEIPEIGHVGINNIDACEAIAKTLEIPVYANGGIDSMAKIKSLRKHQDWHMEGLIIGKPLYEDMIDFGRAREIVEPIPVNRL